MKTIIIGNAGAGKSTLAKKLMQQESAVLLSLDAVAFAGDSERKPLSESVAASEAFIKAHDSWIIEGCYADILASILCHCEVLYFLNPGVDACIAHCRARPWEPDKFASMAVQNQHLDFLLAWVRTYETRTDEYGLARHRALFASHGGTKFELTDPLAYA